MHGAMNKLPMILTSQSADKGKMSESRQWAGPAVSLRAQVLKADMVREGVKKVLGHDGYRKRVRLGMIEGGS